MRWIGQECKRLASCDVYYSCHYDKHDFGCGFVVNNRLRHLVPGFTPMTERIHTILVRTKFYNINLVCVHVPTEKMMMWLRMPSTPNSRTYRISARPMTQKSFSEISMRRSGGRYLWAHCRAVQSPPEHYLQW